MMPGMRVDALWVPPNALFARARFPLLPEHAKPRHHHRLDVFNSSLALADAGARRSEHGHDPANPTVCRATVLVATPAPVFVSALPQCPREPCRLRPLSLMSFFAGRRVQKPSGGARSPLLARL